MDRETLEDHLRRATRNFTIRLPEDQVFALGLELARELARAHAEVPPRFPEIEISTVALSDGKPRLDGGAGSGDARDDLLELGALLHSLATGEKPQLSWHLDGPPAPPLSTLTRRSALRALTTPGRDLRVASATAAVRLLEGALAAGPEGAPPWPSFRGGAERSAFRPGVSPTSLTPHWHARVGSVIASPVLTGSLAAAPTGDGRLLLIDRQSGRQVHEMKLGSASESSPAVAEGVLHVGTDDGELVGVDLADGSERYRVKLGQLVRSSPLVAGNRVIVGVVEGKTAGAVVAVDPAKGKLLWTRKLGAVFSSAALAGSRLLVGSDDGSLHALDLEKGTVIWSHALGGKVRATPAVSGDLAIVGDFEGRLVAVRLSDGARAWSFEPRHPVYSSACLAGGLAVFGCHEGHLHALDAATGTPRFETTTRGPVVASPSAVADRWLVGSTDGSLYLLDGEGRIVQRLPLESGGIQSSAALDGDQLVVGSALGLHSLRLTS